MVLDMKKIIRFCLVLALLLTAADFLAANVLLSAALVPSFMRKLDSFERVTEESYAEMVWTSDIQENRKTALEETAAWLSSVEKKKTTLTSADGFSLVAEYFLQETGGHRFVLLLHGYTGWKEEMEPFARWYWEMGYSVLIPDLRCQGESEGDFIGMGYTDAADALLWLQWINERDPEAEIVVHGQSMGAATALLLSAREDLPDNVTAVVSDCAYRSALSMFRKEITDWFSLPSFPLVDTARLCLLLRGGYDIERADPLAAVPGAKVPVLFLHGTEDKMVPPEDAEALADACGSPCTLLLFEGAGHAQSQDKDPERYFGAIREFLEL